MPAPHGFYDRWLVGILALCLALSWCDRGFLALVLQNVKVDLGLSDTQLGLLTGIVIAIFYSIAGLPIGMLVDRGNRIIVLAATTLVWGIATILCGAVANYGQLLILRTCVGVGEAGCMPTAQSLIAHHFARESRPRAFALFLQGGTLSLVIGYFLAGWLNQIYGWRVTFIVLGIPGLLVAALVFATLREPRRRTSSAYERPPQAKSPTLRFGLKALWRNATYRHLLLCMSATYFFGNGLSQWQPTFFIRSYGIGTGELGTWLALIFGGGSLVGLYLGGEWASRIAPKDEAKQLRICALTYLFFAGVSAVTYLSPLKSVAFALLFLSSTAINMSTSAQFAAIHAVVPDELRGVSIALTYFSANLIGLGLGPLAVGVVSDVLHQSLGSDSLRYTLVALSPGYIWPAWHFWRASQTITHNMIKTQVEQNSLGLGGDAGTGAERAAI